MSTQSEKTVVSPEKILQVGLGFWASRTLLSAVEMELFTELAKQPRTLDDLQGRMGLHERSARDFLDALVSLGFLKREHGVYANTLETGLFLDKARPSYIGGVLEMASHRLYGFWNHLTEALRTGLPQNEIKSGGPSMFSALYADPARLRGFLQAMSGISHGANLAIAAKFPWQQYKTFIDVGTAQGDLAAQVALAHPHLSGIGFDLAEVGPIFEDCHDWDLAQKKALIRKAYDALPTGGAFIVYESIIDDDRRQNAFGLLMSLNMLIETPGGFDYTGADCIGWMKEAGFKEARVEHLVGPDSMVVGIK